MLAGRYDFYSHVKIYMYVGEFLKEKMSEKKTDWSLDS
jgi:hypothetical protein